MHETYEPVIIQITITQVITGYLGQFIILKPPYNLPGLALCIAGYIEPVDCVSGDIRLINGTSKSQGRLEVCIGNVWGTVCGRSWDTYDSQVVCKQLGYQRLGIQHFFILVLLLLSGASYDYGLYGHGSGPILFGYMYCNGNEESLFDCSRNVQSVVSGSCIDHYYDIGLKCER